MAADDAGPSWTFLTNHAHVLICIAQDRAARMRDIAARVGITERGAQAIVTDLVNEGYLSRTRVGRRNEYEVHPDLPLRHEIERDHQVGELLDILALGPMATPSSVAMAPRAAPAGRAARSAPPPGPRKATAKATRRAPARSGTETPARPARATKKTTARRSRGG